MKKMLFFVVVICAITSVSAQLSESEKTSIGFMREEEKLAYDTYRSFQEKWQSAPFANILKAEHRHMELLKGLILKYGIKDPIAEFENKAGVFPSASFQKLYDEFIKRGSISLVEALKTGALIEEMDIVDLEVRRAQSTTADVVQTYDLLIKASENHLQAFVRNLSRNGVTYSPQMLTKARFDTIVKANKSNGRGQGRKQMQRL